MSLHKWLGTAMPFLLITLAVWRHRFHARETAAPPVYLASASAMLLAMVVQGHVGAAMTFGATHALAPAPQGNQSPEQHHANDEAASDGWQDSIPLTPRERRHE